MTADGSFRLETTAPGTIGAVGALTFATAAAALETINAAVGQETQRLDLACLGRTDSAGLACVLAAKAEAARRGHALEVINPPEKLRLLAQVCEVDAWMGPATV